MQTESTGRVSQYEDVQDKIFALGGRRMSNDTLGNGDTLDIYLLGGQMVVVQTFGHHGYEIFLPTPNSSVETFKLLEGIAQGVR
jgi:hypothetical protein